MTIFVQRNARPWRETGVEDVQVVDDTLGAGFERFYLDHHADAVRWAAAIVGRVDVAEDLAHDVLIRVGGRIEDLDDPVPYLRRSIVNACHSWYRSTSRQERRDAADAAAGPRSTLEPRDVEVLDVLARLPYRQRATLVLRHWAGWSDAEIAGALGCREATVRSHSLRALTALRQQLSSVEESP